jgi:hypothetical protein
LTTIGAELAGQLGEEGRVDVDLLVQRAVERAHLVGGRAASRLSGSGVEDGRRHRVLLAVLREQLGPIGLDAVDGRHDQTLVVAVGVGTGLALGEVVVLLAARADLALVQGAALRAGRRRVRHLGAATADDAAAEDHHEDQQDQAADAAADLDAAGERSAAASPQTAAAAPRPTRSVRCRVGRSR